MWALHPTPTGLTSTLQPLLQTLSYSTDLRNLHSLSMPPWSHWTPLQMSLVNSLELTDIYCAISVQPSDSTESHIHVNGINSTNGMNSQIRALIHYSYQCLHIIRITYCNVVRVAQSVKRDKRWDLFVSPAIANILQIWS